MTDLHCGVRRSTGEVPLASSPAAKRTARPACTSPNLQPAQDFLATLAAVLHLEKKRPNTRATAARPKVARDVGVGFGGACGETEQMLSSMASTSSTQVRDDQALCSAFLGLTNIVDAAEGVEMEQAIMSILSGSCLYAALCELLGNGSLLDIGRRPTVYAPLLSLVVSMSRKAVLAQLLLAKDNTQARSAVSLLRELDQQSQVFLRNAKEEESEDESFLRIAQSIRCACEAVFPLAQGLDGTDVPQASDESSCVKRYIKMLRKECFDLMDLQGSTPHKFKAAALSAQPAGRLARERMAEVAALSASLPCDWDGAVAVRVDEANCSLLKVLIIGGHGTPYANGCFLFDLLLPSTYPAQPPKVHFLTTSSSTRMNPNLYTDGSVCLSLLGTWVGPGWIAHTSTILQVLVSIQALIFVPEPYYNEPGYEMRQGTQAGEMASSEYNKHIRTYTAKLAILDQLRSPPPCFASLIREHFRLKMHEVLSQLRAWEPIMAEHHYQCRATLENWNPSEVINDIEHELMKLTLSSML